MSRLLKSVGWILIFIFLWRAPSLCFGDVDWTIAGGARQTYDDNITFVRDAVKKDWVTDTFLILGAKYDREEEVLNLLGSVTQHTFAQYNHFDNTSADFNIDFKKDFFERGLLSIADVLTHAEEPRSFEDAFGRNSGRYAYFKNVLHARYATDILRSLKAHAGYLHELMSFSNESGSDSYMNRINSGVEYSVNEKMLLSSDYEYVQRNFNSDIRAKMHALTGGCRYYLTRRLSLDASAGMNFVIAYNGEYYHRPLMKCSIVHDFDEGAQAMISWEKKDQTNGYATDLFRSQQASLSFSKRLFERLRCSMSAFFGKGAYVASGTKDKFRGANCALTYDVSNRWTCELSYGYSASDSNVIDRGYVKNLVSVGATVEF